MQGVDLSGPSSQAGPFIPSFLSTGLVVCTVVPCPQSRRPGGEDFLSWPKLRGGSHPTQATPSTGLPYLLPLVGAARRRLPSSAGFCLTIPSSVLFYGF